MTLKSRVNAPLNFYVKNIWCIMVSLVEQWDENKKYITAIAAGAIGAVVFAGWLAFGRSAGAAYRFSNFKGKPPIHMRTSGEKMPSGIAPGVIKKIYNLPLAGGTGTVAIIDAYDDATIEGDLGVFDAAYGLAACTTKMVALWHVQILL
jgi:subtilase family serine protease